MSSLLQLPLTFCAYAPHKLVPFLHLLKCLRAAGSRGKSFRCWHGKKEKKPSNLYGMSTIYLNTKQGWEGSQIANTVWRLDFVEAQMLQKTYTSDQKLHIDEVRGWVYKLLIYWARIILKPKCRCTAWLIKPSDIVERLWIKFMLETKTVIFWESPEQLRILGHGFPKGRILLSFCTVPVYCRNHKKTRGLPTSIKFHWQNNEQSSVSCK